MILTQKEIEQSHIIVDLTTELGRTRAAVSEARELLALAASRTGEDAVLAEFIDRAYLKLGSTCPGKVPA